MERRMYNRVALETPIPCTCRIGDDEPMQGIIKNVGLMGVMVELPGLEECLIMECCQEVLLDEDDAKGCLFSGKVGTVHWVYKNYVGIAFASRLQPSHDALVKWLEERTAECGVEA